MSTAFQPFKLGVVQALATVLLCAFPTLLPAQGSLDSWGYDGTNAVSDMPGGTGFTQVACGGFHSVGLRSNGTVGSWGLDSNHQVSATPAGTGFIQVSGGYWHSLALRADGSISSWGEDGDGQVSGTPTAAAYSQVDGGWFFSLALRNDGRVVGWGDNGSGQVSNVPLGSGFTQVSAGAHHALALRSDGTIAAWGNDSSGCVTNTPTEPGFIQVSAGWFSGLALRADGSIVEWGASLGAAAPSGVGFTQVLLGRSQAVALTADGSILVWGNDAEGQVTDAPPGRFFSHVASGIWHLSALRTVHPGSPFCFGDGSGASCPCAATGFPREGCPSSSGAGSTLLGLGNAELSTDSFLLAVKGIPGAKPGLILRGSNQLNGGLGNLNGDGLLCAAGQSVRSQIQVTVDGQTTFTDFRGSPFGAWSFGPGIPTNYQFWYRDPQNPCTGLGYNFSNAWTVTWAP